MGFFSIVFTMSGFGCGIVLGLAAGYFMFIYFEPDDVKDPMILRLNKLDLKSLQEILPEIPPWVKSPDHDKVDWLNMFMHEMWPYVDKAVCEIIRSTAEPYIVEYKPKYNLESVEFETLTLGTLPPVFMGVKVYETQEKEMMFEVAAKFAGNPNVKVAVKAYGLKAVAQLVDVQLFATARITLKPLIPVLPCFSQINVSLMEKPFIDFGLKVFKVDLMAIPGLYRYIQNMLTQTVSTMYLWPNKLEVPIGDNFSTEKKPQGVLSVTVVRAKHLRNKDILGKSDPYVRLTVGNSIQKTRVIMNNLNPEWNENFRFIVDDFETNSLDISAYDWDQVGAHDKLGMQVIPLHQLIPEEQQVFTLNLLKTLDLNDATNQKNRGQITLELTYKPFSKEDDEDDEDEDDFLERNEQRDNRSGKLSGNSDVSQTSAPLAPPPGGGLLVVIVHEAEDLEGKHHTNPYVKVIFRGEKRRSKVIKKNRDPRWEAEFEYVLDEAPVQDRLLLEINSKSSHNIMHYRESLGHVEIDLADVVKNRRINEKYQLLDSKSGRVHVELHWRSTGTVSKKSKDPS